MKLILFCIIAGLAFVAGAGLILKYHSFTGDADFWLISIAIVTVGSLLTALPYKSSAFRFEFSTIALAWLILKGPGTGNAVFLYLPMVASTLCILGYKVAPRTSAILAWLITAAWFWWLSGLPGTPAQHILFWFTVAMLVIYTVNAFSGPVAAPKRIDFILCSYSGNTAHYAEPFIAGARDTGAEVAIQRFHYYKEFNADLTGDGLAVAFPVIGWKPPWPFLNYLILRLPRGRGKPAYIMYSSAGGPENAGVLVWLILILKGYRVIGRSWAAYPINIATFRLGLKKLWRWLDSIVPISKDTPAQSESGRRFAQGQSAGLPFILWPTPLAIVGIITDNKIIDSILYHNHVFRRRCTKCGLCINFCPAQRLRIGKDGYPASGGACVLCTGCVNLCPSGAMHIWCLTEYGNAYKPRWPGLIIRKKDQSSPATSA